MKKIFFFGAVLIGFTAVAGPVSAEPTELKAHELDRITAGQAQPPPNGGAIVGNDSSAILNSSGEVIIIEGAQAETRALNLVNSSESTVANGVNVFDGRVNEEADISEIEFNIEQMNSVTQDQRRLSSLPSYDRGANTMTSLEESGSSTASSTQAVYDQVTDLETHLLLDEAVTDGGYEQSSSPTLKIDFQLGEFLNYDAELNMPSAGNSVGVVFNGELDYAIPPATATLETEIGDDNAPLKIELTSPSLDLDFDAMGCVAVNGSCTINGSRTEKDETISDHSTLYTLDETESASEEWAGSSTEIVHAPFQLRDAQAEYIVVDESEIDVSANYVVNLTGGAQSGLRAMNVVNAAGSAVANGVNVATQRTGTLSSSGPAFNLTQINEITHSR